MKKVCHTINLDDELACPFCGTPTELKDRRCPACRQRLWIRGRAIPVPHHIYHFLLKAEGALIFVSSLYPALLLTFIDTYLPTNNLRILAFAALGLGDSVGATNTRIQTLVPIDLARLSLLQPLLTTVILILIAIRWLPLYIPAVVLGAIRFLLALTMVIYGITGQVAPPSPDATWAVQMPSEFNTAFRIAILAGSILITIASTYLLISLLGVQDHFISEDRRLLLAVDKDCVGSSTSLWIRGRDYAKEKVWAKAALHLRESVWQEPDLAAYKLLAVAYANLNAYAMAMQTLDQAMPLARHLDPENEGGFPQLRTMIAERQAKLTGPAPLAVHASPDTQSVETPVLPQSVDFDETSAASNLPLSATLPPITSPSPEGFAHPDAIIEAERQQLRQRLLALIEADESNVEAWLQLSHVVDTDEEREICLENVLTLEPEHTEAQAQLAALKQQLAYIEAHTWSSEAPPLTRNGASTLAGDILGEAYREKHTVILPEPEPAQPSPTAILWAKYENPYLCPTCATPTQLEDRRCPSCRRRLWVTQHVQAERSSSLWLLILLQAWSTTLFAAAPVLAVIITSYQLGIEDSAQLLPAYIGLPSRLPDTIVTAAMAQLSPIVFFLLWIPFLVGLALVAGLYFRWRPMFYLLLAYAVLGLVGSLASIVLARGRFVTLGCGIAGALAAFVMASTVLRLEDDFALKRQRVFLEIDPGLKTGQDYLVRGRHYASQGIWGAAMIHYRRAAAQLDHQMDVFIGIAQACAHLHDHALATWAIASAQALRPDDTRLAEILTLLRKEDMEKYQP